LHPNRSAPKLLAQTPTRRDRVLHQSYVQQLTFCFLSSLPSEPQQLLVRNQNAPSDAPYCQLLFYDERVQRPFADSNEPSGFRFAVEQNMPVHIDTSGFSVI
jgi:hypothetical protein